VKCVLVTGSARGIGAAICRRLEEAGYTPIRHVHTGSGGDIACDLATEEGTSSLAAYCADKPLFGVVYNVGPYLQKQLLETTPEEVHYLFETNLFAPMELARQLAPSLIEHQGCVVHLGLAGLTPFRDDRRAAAYRLSKLALWGYTRALAAELASKGVRVNMVSPGQAEGSVDKGEIRLPMGRRASHDEIAATVVQLFAAESSYITGQNIEVAGGYAL